MRSLIFLIPLIFLLSCGSPEENKARQDACSQSVRDKIDQRCTEACERDPVFTACSAETGEKAIGSGCPDWYKRMTKDMQVNECKKEACGFIPFEAVEHCYR
ncbi:hypothetical protein OAC45_04010 [Gammaproteobacteria bacterium]|nr:hypothetical protein [Gammaproteobacteria bacterium]